MAPRPPWARVANASRTTKRGFPRLDRSRLGGLGLTPELGPRLLSSGLHRPENRKHPGESDLLPTSPSGAERFTDPPRPFRPDLAVRTTAKPTGFHQPAEAGGLLRKQTL